MNCRFCGNFVPDGSDSCPVCGRRPEEDPIGKLLSDNRPGVESEQKNAVDAKSTNSLKPQNLGGSIVAIILSIAAWIYGNSMGAIGNIQSLLGQNGAAEALTLQPTNYLIIGLVVVATVVGFIGLITFFKRAINNIRYMR